MAVDVNVFFDNLQQAGSVAATQQERLLREYGSAVDNDVTAGLTTVEPLVELVSQIPGITVDETVKKNLSQHVAGSHGLRADFLNLGRESWVEVGVDFSPRSVEVLRVDKFQGLGVKFIYDQNGVVTEIEVKETKWYDRNGFLGRGGMKLATDGTVKSADGSLGRYQNEAGSTRFNIASLVEDMTTLPENSGRHPGDLLRSHTQANGPNPSA